MMLLMLLASMILMRIYRLSYYLLLITSPRMFSGRVVPLWQKFQVGYRDGHGRLG